jgi:hypothetical protein
MARSRSRACLLAWLASMTSLSACAQILGDDFVVVDDDDDDDGSSSGPEECDNQGSCDDCIFCGCAAETKQCFGNNEECSLLADCVGPCTDSACVEDCGATYPDGIADYTTWNDCGCYNACINDCAFECSG